jgi:hypothetical protein
MQSDSTEERNDPDTVTTIKDIASQWQQTIQQDCLTPPANNDSVADTDGKFAPLDQPGYTSCRGKHDDIIPEDVYRSLLCEPASVRRLDLSASEIPADDLAAPQTYYDLDSAIIYLASLAAHKAGFTLFCRPPAWAQLGGAQTVTVNGVQLHTTKHMGLGHGVAAGGARFKTYIFFPHFRSAKTHLPTDEEMQIWIDEILFPALEEHCADHVIQHYPHDFLDVKARSGVSAENPMSSNIRPANHQIDIPQEDLAAVWTSIVRRCRAADSKLRRLRFHKQDSFRDPMLVAIAHGVKNQYRATSMPIAASEAIRRFDAYFEMDQVLRDSCWVDIAAETIQAFRSPSEEKVTLICRRSCLSSWAGQFADKRGEQTKIKIEEYYWAGTGDGGACTVRIGQTNLLRPFLAKVKQYNCSKEMYSTLWRKHVGFSSPYFRAMGYSDQLIYKFAKARSKNASETQALRPKLLRAYERTKTRLQAITRIRRDFGTRVEYTISFSVLEELASRSGSEVVVGYGAAAGRDGAGTHSPFYPLRTEEACEFLAAGLNRWLLLLERTASLAEIPAPHQARSVFARKRTDVTEEEMGMQLHRAPVVALALDAAQFLLDGNTIEHYGLWRRQWTRRGKRRRRAALRRSVPADESYSSDDSPSTGGFGNGISTRDTEESDLDTDDEGDRSNDEREPRHKCSAMRLGMDFRRVVTTHGVPWVPEHMLMWEQDPPIFPVHIREHLPSYATSYFTGQRGSRLALSRALVTAENARMRLFVHTLRESVQTGTTAEVLSLAAELCVQQATLDILNHLEELWVKDEVTRVTSRSSSQGSNAAHISAARERWKARAPPQMLVGTQGLCARSLGALFGTNPVEIGNRSMPYLNMSQCIRGRLGRVGPIYDTARWCDRVFVLFNWDRPGVASDPYRSKRAWDNKPFRAFTRKMYSVIEREAGRRDAEDFLTVRIPMIAGGTLLAVPAVEPTAFYQYKRGPSQYKLPVLKFWIPRFESPKLQSQYRALILGESPQPELRRHYWNHLLFDLQVWREGKPGNNMTYAEIPISRSYIDSQAPLQRALEFATKVEEWRHRE